MGYRGCGVLNGDLGSAELVSAGVAHGADGAGFEVDIDADGRRGHEVARGRSRGKPKILLPGRHVDQQRISNHPIDVIARCLPRGKVAGAGEHRHPAHIVYVVIGILDHRRIRTSLDEIIGFGPTEIKHVARQLFNWRGPDKDCTGKLHALIVNDGVMLDNPFNSCVQTSDHAPGNSWRAKTVPDHVVLDHHYIETCRECVKLQTAQCDIMNAASGDPNIRSIRLAYPPVDAIPRAAGYLKSFNRRVPDMTKSQCSRMVKPVRQLRNACDHGALAGPSLYGQRVGCAKSCHWRE